MNRHRRLARVAAHTFLMSMWATVAPAINQTVSPLGSAEAFGPLVPHPFYSAAGWDAFDHRCRYWVSEKDEETETSKKNWQPCRHRLELEVRANSAARKKLDDLKTLSNASKKNSDQLIDGIESFIDTHLYLAAHTGYSYQHGDSKTGFIAGAQVDAKIRSPIIPIFDVEATELVSIYHNRTWTLLNQNLRLGATVRPTHLMRFSFHDDAFAILDDRDSLKLDKRAKEGWFLMADAGASYRHELTAHQHLWLGAALQDVSLLKPTAAALIHRDNDIVPQQLATSFATNIAYVHTRPDMDISRVATAVSLDPDPQKSASIHPIRLGLALRIKEVLDIDLGRYDRHLSYGVGFFFDHVRVSFSMVPEVLGVTGNELAIPVYGLSILATF